MRLIAVFLTLFLFCISAQAVTIGPAMTKNERERRELSRPAQSPRGYETVLKHFLNEDFVESERLAERFLKHGPRNGHSDEVSYLRALSLMKLGRYAEARPLLKQLESEGSAPELRAQAAYSLGDSFYFENKRAEADSYYKEAILRYPEHGEAGQVKRLLGLAPRPLRQNGIEEKAAEGFSVQVGAFTRRRNAERLLNKLLRNHYDAYINREEASHYRVRIGHLPLNEDAQALAARLQKDGYPTRIFP